METFDHVARRYLVLQGVLLRAVEEDDKPVIMALIQRTQTICDDTITLLSDKKEKLVREQKELLEETQTKLNTELEKAKEDHANFKHQVEQQANEKCEKLLDEKEKRMKEQNRQTIQDKKEKVDAQYEKRFTNRITKKEADLDTKYDGRKTELESEYARRSEELNKEKQDTIATRDSLNKSIEAIKLLNDSLDTLSPQRLGQSGVVGTLLSRQSQEGDLTSAPHQAHDTAASYFSQLDSATQSLEEERRRQEETRAALTSADNTLTELRGRIAGLEGEKATLEARLRTTEEQLQQQTTALEEKIKEHENDKESLRVLRSAQRQDVRRKRARYEAADKGPTFWYRTMKDASEALDLFFVAKSCSMKANELVPRLWDVLDDGSLYKRLLGFHNNAQASNWRCLRRLVTKGSFVEKPLPETGCPHHPSEEKCLQVRIVEEEEGGRAMDFRMA
ncbi:hypothetical protein FSOLCH5_005458 [Fusarium solani]